MKEFVQAQRNINPDKTLLIYYEWLAYSGLAIASPADPRDRYVEKAIEAYSQTFSKSPGKSELNYHLNILKLLTPFDEQNTTKPIQVTLQVTIEDS